jgi:Tfp pilus assembly protein PilV
VEVMMATVIMMVGFIGMMEAVAIASNTMDHARRQTLATQIINHEIEELFLADWSTISALPTASTAITIDSQFDAARLAVGDNGTATAIVRFSLARTVTSPDPVTNIREVNFTVTWIVTAGRVGSAVSQGGRTTATGADDYASNIRRANTTHTRANSVWLGKYGLHLSYPQS